MDPSAAGPSSPPPQPQKPKKDLDDPVNVARPEAAHWDQGDAILQAAKENGSGWHHDALGSIGTFLDDRASGDMATAADLNEQVQHEAAREIYQRVLRDMEATKGPAHPYTARALNGLATAVGRIPRGAVSCAPAPGTFKYVS